MLISVVKNHPINLRIGKESWESSWRWQISLATNIEPSEVELSSTEAGTLQKYCKKLKEILGFGKKANTATVSNDISGNLCIHFQMSPTYPTKTCLKLHGKILENILQLCGNDTKVIMEVNFNELIQGGEGGNIPGQIASFNKQIKTSELSLCLPLQNELETKIPASTSTNGSCLNVGAFCDNIEVPLPENFIDTCNNHRAKSDIVSNMTVSVLLVVDDLYINYDPGTFKRLQSTCSDILIRHIYADASIVSSTNSVHLCHQCYLAVHSPVLAAVLDKMSKDQAKSIRIQISDISEDCVNAMLEYFYTLDTTKPFQCSKLAVELFQISYKYEIRSLEEHLADMFPKRGSKWFDVNAALDLFRFARGLEKYVELKVLMIRVLKSKGKLLTDSENYRNLFIEDPTAAM